MKTEECTGLSERNDQLKKQLAAVEADGQEASNTKVKMIEDKVAHLERSATIKDGELAELRTAVAVKEAAVKEVTSKCEDTEVKISDLESTTKELRRLLGTNQEEKSKLRDELREGRRLEAEIRTALTERELASNSLQRRIEEAHEKLHLQTNEQTLTHKSQITEMTAERAQLHEKVEALEEELKEQQQDIRHMVEEADLAKGSRKETKVSTGLLLFFGSGKKENNPTPSSATHFT